MTREQLEYWADSGDAKKLIVAISLRKLSINAPSGVGPVLPMRLVVLEVCYPILLVIHLTQVYQASLMLLLDLALRKSKHLVKRATHICSIHVYRLKLGDDVDLS